MYKDIKDVFKVYLKDVTFDKKFLDKLIRFRIGWINRNNEHMDFIGSNLLGVHTIKFTVLDEETLFMDILDINESKLKKDLMSLEDIDPSRRTTSNVVYLTLTYLMHGFMTSKHLNNSLKEHAVKEIYFIFAYKAMSSLYSHYFKYPVKKDIAIAVHEKLSNKFYIKKYNTWQEVFNKRADVLTKDGLHFDRVKEFTTYDATRIIMDLQGRLRDTVKIMFLLILDVVNNNESIRSTTLDVMDEDGEEHVRDIIDRPDIYARYIKSIVFKHSDFINVDLMYVVNNLIDLQGNKSLYIVLNHISENSISKRKDTDLIIDNSLNLSIAYLSKLNIVKDYESNLSNILNILKNYYNGSRVKDRDMDNLKKVLKKVYIESTGNSGKTVLASVRVGVILYIFLRSLNRS